MSYFSVFNDLSNILTVFFQLFLFFKFQAHFSVLWICLAFRSIFSKIWWHLLFVWLFIQNCNLQSLSFFQQCILNRISESSSIFFDDFFQHQNLLSELDFFSFFQRVFHFFHNSFSIFQRFFPTFFLHFPTFEFVWINEFFYFEDFPLNSGASFTKVFFFN